MSSRPPRSELRRARFRARWRRYILRPLTVAGRPTRRELRRQRSRARIRRRARSVVALLVVAGMAVFGVAVDRGHEIAAHGCGIGYTADGRYIAALFDMVDDITVIPVTAYEVPEPQF
jgi:hypothetical protein